MKRVKNWACERLPEGYELYERIDIAADAAKPMVIFGVLLTAGMILWGVFGAGHPISEAFQMEPFRVIFAAFGMIVGMVVYIFVHEGIHGFFIKMFSGRPPFYGKNLKKGMFYAGSSCFFDSRAYVVIALAPLIVWGIVIALMLSELSTEAPQFWWYLYVIQIFNFTGAAGDLYITGRVLRMPKDVLVQDDGILMKFFLPAKLTGKTDWKN